MTVIKLVIVCSTHYYRIALDEECVIRLMDVICSMVNPWSLDDDKLVVSLSSGIEANQPATEDLKRAHQLGELQLKEFLSRVMSGARDEMFKPIKANKLLTMSNKVQKARKTEEVKVLKADRSVFTRLLVVAQTRDIDLKEVFTYSLAPIPPALSSYDGKGLSKTNKAQLLHCIEEHCADENLYLGSEDLIDSTLLVDAMAVIQSMPKSQIIGTFKDLSSHVLQKIVQLSNVFAASRIDFIGDRYLNLSIKQSERQRRTNAHSSQLWTIYGDNQLLPKQWSKFLNSGTNKERLLEFLKTDWQTRTCDKEMLLYIAVDDKCISLSFKPGLKPVIHDVIELECNHEEADTRIILHMLHTQTCQRIIYSPDTDVAIIAIEHIQSITDDNCQVLFATGRQAKSRIIDLTKVARNLGSELSSALVGLHAVSGCDSVSSFTGKSKAKWFNYVKQTPEFISTLASLGKDFTLSTSLADLLESVVCKIYGGNENQVNINELRWKIFCSSNASERSLPPNKDALLHHLQRANYQARIWRLASSSKYNRPSPDGYGWKLENNELKIVWLEHPYAPQSITEFIVCSCKKTKCTSGRCNCSKMGLKCTDLCHCNDCANRVLQEDEECQQEPIQDEEDDDDTL